MGFSELVVIAIYMSLIAFCIGISLYKKVISDPVFLTLAILLTITLIVESIGYYNILTKNRIIGWLFSVFLPVQYFLYALYFRNIIKSVKIKKAIAISIVFVFVWNICNAIFFQNLKTLNTYAIIIACLFYCAWSSIYLTQLLQTSQTDTLSQNPHFWICSGTLFFYSISFFIIAFIQIINKGNNGLASQLWFLVRVFNIILYGLYAYGFICQTKYQNLPS